MGIGWDSLFQFRYKVRSYKGSAYLGYHIRGVETDDSGRLLSFRVLYFYLQGNLDSALLLRAGNAWARAVQSLSEETKGQDIRMFVGSLDNLAREMAQTMQLGTVYLPLIVTVLILFCLANTMRTTRLDSKPVEGLP